MRVSGLPVLFSASIAMLSGVMAIPLDSPPTPDTYVRVQYAANDTQPGFQKFFKYGECYPYTVEGHKAEVAVFLQSTTCYEYSNADCTGKLFPPIGVPVASGVPLVNLFDFVHLIGGSALCYRGLLPNIPLVPGIVSSAVEGN